MDCQPAMTHIMRALALAHAALDEAPGLHVLEVRRHALAVLSGAKAAQPDTLADARELLTLVDQLRGLVGLLETKLLKAPAAFHS